MITVCVVVHHGTANDRRTETDGHAFPAMLLFGPRP
jgi:hypothetical protein